MANLITMLLDQVKAGRKIDGVRIHLCGRSGEYELTNYDLAAKTFDFTEVTEAENKEVVTITEDNFEVAHYSMNPNPKVAAVKTSLHGDKMVYENAFGTEVETSLGNLSADMVLGSMAGNIYLALAPENGERKVVRYEMQTDKFFDLNGRLPEQNLTVVTNVPDKILIISQQFESQKVDETVDGTPVMMPVCVENVIYGINGEYISSSELDDTKALIKDIRPLGNELYLALADEALADNGTKVKVNGVNVVVFDTYLNLFTEVTVKGSMDSVKAAVSGQYNEVITIRSDEEFVAVNGNDNYELFDITDKKVLDELGDVIVFTGKYKEYRPDGSSVMKYAYASKDLSKVKRFTEDKTDRGTFYEVK